MDRKDYLFKFRISSRVDGKVELGEIAQHKANNLYFYTDNSLWTNSIYPQR